MANTIASARGFILRIGINRSGLVQVQLLKDDSSTLDLQLQDLDADPERFNERLSKLGLLRDAMNRAEPVELSYLPDDKTGGLEIDAIARLTRDADGSPQKIEIADGLVVNLQLFAENRTVSGGETPDRAKVSVLLTDLSQLQLSLNMQIPERQVAAQQFQWILAAHSSGDALRFYYDSADHVIFAVASSSGDSGFGGDQAQTLDGFVESLSPSSAGAGAAFSEFTFTTAPAFAGSGNYIPLQAYSPTTLSLLIARGSPGYALVEAGLRDALRMQIRAYDLSASHDAGRDAADGASPPSVRDERLGLRADGNAKVVVRDYISESPAPALVVPTLVAGRVSLLAPLASASRPVWVRIARESLDHGIECAPCTDGVPTSDLTPRTLRDLRLPYPAQWSGWGCFNHGVYRFQFTLAVPLEVLLDGEPLCLHAGDDAGIRFGHACLGGEHQVEVRLMQWTCDQDFVMDIYRIR